MAAEVIGGSLLTRPDAVARTYLRAYSLGPVSLGDTTAGIQIYAWRARLDGNEVFICRAADDGESWAEESLLFSFEGAAARDVDIAFNTNGGVVVSLERDGESRPEVWLYYFSTIANQYVFEKMSDGRSPRLILDTTEPLDEADIVLFYLNDTTQRVEYRTQRELFAQVALVPVDAWYNVATRQSYLQDNTQNMWLEDTFRSRDYRVHLIASVRNPITGQYSLIAAESNSFGLRPVERTELTQKIDWLEVQFYVHEIILVEDVELTQNILIAALQELVLEVGSGPAGWLEPEAVRVAQLIASVEVWELIIPLENQLPETVSVSQQILSMAVSLFVIDQNHQEPEEVRVSQKLLTVTVETI